MATLLYRLGKTAYRRWPLFIAGWVLLLVSVGAFAAGFSKPFSDSFSIPGIPSEEAADLQAELFPDTRDAFDEATVNVVVAAPEGHTIDEQPYADRIAALIADLADGPQMPAALDDPQAQDALNPALLLESNGPPKEGTALAAFSNVSADGRVGVITFAFDVDTVADVEMEAKDAVTEAMDDARGDGLEVEANGQGLANMEAPGGVAELIGIGIALMVLVLTFGAFVTAGLPILSALIGVGLGSAGVLALTAFTDLSSSTPMLATMIGLAVAIDYSLFILARYRAELHHTDDRAEAAGIAVGTSGSAVVFAGLTVLIALAALSIVRIPFLTAMGLAAAATVFIAVLVALTLLPAFLGMLKHRAFAGRVRTYDPRREGDGQVLNNGVRWARLVAKRPAAFAILTVVVLGILAVPLKDLYLAFPTDSTAPTDTTQRKASDLLTDGFGPGRDGTFQLVVDGRALDPGQRNAAYDEIVTWAEQQDGVQAAILAPALLGMTPEDIAAAPGTQVLLVPQYGPDDERTKALLEDLRDREGQIEDATGTDIGITGLTAITTDVSDRLNGALPLYLLVVIGLAFVLLMLVFRSILVPLTATLGFALSVLATLGVTVAIFQEGMFGLMDGQPIVSFMPIFMIGVVFGLAMDYQVFLVTRMREAHVHGSNTHDAVVDGFRNSARVVTAAAVIMIAVFAGFILEDDAIVKSMGFALAAAIIFDAFIVRMVLIPALMFLLGEKAWWLPAWLDRILPDVDVEGEKLDRPHLQRAAAEGTGRAGGVSDDDLVSTRS